MALPVPNSFDLFLAYFELVECFVLFFLFFYGFGSYIGFNYSYCTICILFLSEPNINWKFYPLLGQCTLEHFSTVYLFPTPLQLCFNFKSHKTLSSLLYSQYTFTFMHIFTFFSFHLFLHFWALLLFRIFSLCLEHVLKFPLAWNSLLGDIVSQFWLFQISLIHLYFWRLF